MTDADRLGFQLSLLHLAYQGNPPEALVTELQSIASNRGVPVRP
jgi:hypothetical protein